MPTTIRNSRNRTYYSKYTKIKKGLVQLRNEIEYERSFTLTQLYASKDDDEDDIVENMISVGLTLLGAPQ